MTTMMDFMKQLDREKKSLFNLVGKLHNNTLAKVQAIVRKYNANGVIFDECNEGHFDPLIEKDKEHRKACLEAARVKASKHAERYVLEANHKKTEQIKEIEGTIETLKNRIAYYKSGVDEYENQFKNRTGTPLQNQSQQTQDPPDVQKNVNNQ